jgi:hypothetical protein
MKQDGLLLEDRMFVRKNMNEDVGMFINDNKGNPRIKIYIDRDNNPKIELLNEEGNIIKKEKEGSNRQCIWCHPHA